MVNLVGLSGKAGAGKDTAADALASSLGYQKLSFATEIKKLALILNPIMAVEPGSGRQIRLRELIKVMDWSAAKQHSPELRRFLQVLGTEGGRDVFGENVWVNRLFSTLGKHLNFYVITDVRFPNEADAIHDRGGQVWRIHRPEREVLEALAGVDPNVHESETALDNYTSFDHYIANDGSKEDFESKIIELGRSITIVRR